MHDNRCHTSDPIQNVKNYFEIINYEKYLKENNLQRRICKCCNYEFIANKGEIYCKNCLVETVCCECKKPLGRLLL